MNQAAATFVAKAYCREATQEIGITLLEEADFRKSARHDLLSSGPSELWGAFLSERPNTFLEV
jgi:hypothetical protein